MNPAGIAGALNYYEDGITPYMLFFKDGVVSEKFVSTLMAEKSHCRNLSVCHS